MNIRNKNIHKAFLTALLIIIGSHLFALKLPVYLNWHSSNAFTVYDMQYLESARLKHLYRVNTGVDHLFSKGIRTGLEITNKEEMLESKILLRHAYVEYKPDKYFVKFSIHDFGFGNTFHLYNRNYDDYYFDENVLLNSRWIGMHSGYADNSNKWSIGLGGNELNWLLCETSYQKKLDQTEANVYVHYTLKDSDNSVMAFDAGTELKTGYKALKLHSGFNYNYQPESFCMSELFKWHLVNELQILISNDLRFILSLDLQTKRKDTKVNYLSEFCLDFKKNAFQSYAGLRKQNILTKDVFTSFLDVNYNLTKNFTVGCLFNHVNTIDEDAYVKFAIQTKYVLN